MSAGRDRCGTGCISSTASGPISSRCGAIRGDVKVLGYVAALAEQGPTRGPQNVFVNRRIVKDRTIAHAIIDSYSVASIKERSPEVHLFIDDAADAVDVNVHPTKAEVRFRDQSHMHEVIRRTLGDALGRGPVPEFQFEAPIPVRPPRDDAAAADNLRRARSRAGGRPVRLQADTTTLHVIPAQTDAVSGFSRTEGEIAPTVEGGVVIRPMIALGQFRDTFIIAVDEEGIAIVDQHVAHERVLFERIMERLSGGRLESQRLLEPMLIELPAAARQALSAHTAELERLGFEIEEFGGDAIRMISVPALAAPGGMRRGHSRAGGGSRRARSGFRRG